MSKTAKAVRYDEIEGKVVSGAGYGSDRMLIAFTDGTVLALTADGDCDGPEIDFAQGRDIDLLSNTWISESHEAGLVSRDEYLAQRDKEESDKIKRLEEQLDRAKRNREWMKSKVAERAATAGEQS